MTMTMRERKATKRLWTDWCEGMPEDRLRGKEYMYEYNHSRPSEKEKRDQLLQEMFGAFGGGTVEPPVYFCYGSNVFIGKHFYANFNLNLVDDYTITIGDDVKIAPNVTIAVTNHPLDPEKRREGGMYALPVVIGNNVWIGSGAIICPGVTIGEGSVIGAGSVVTRDIPPNVIAVGNPCKVVREFNDHDKIYYYKDMKFEE